MEKTPQVLIIGSGFGAATAAYHLTQSNFKVLMIERGDWPKRDNDDWSPRQIIIKQRYKSRSPLMIKQYGNKNFRTTFPEEVVGGKSLFYGGAALRLRTIDFKSWPITYDELEPYYTKSEHLLGVHGDATLDPISPPRSAPYPFHPIPFQPPAQRVFDSAKRLDLQPFPLPTAINFTDKHKSICIRCNTCDGYPCKIEAKNEAITALLYKAQKQGLKIITNAIVQKFVTRNGKAVEVEIVDKNTAQRLTLTSDIFLLGAGALSSPAILLQSGFSHAFIGKCLMRHCNAFVSSVFPFITNPNKVFHKQLCFMDWYENMRDHLGTSVGNIQDNCMPPAEVIRHFAPYGLKVIAHLLAEFIQGLLVIAEDDPIPENKVYLSNQLDPYGHPIAKVEHQYTVNDIARRNFLITQAKRILHKMGGLITKNYYIDTFSHAVGTLRFGKDQRTSVLNSDCQVFGVPNLFVIDGSFMPTSAGVNPSLTIVANALRVAEKISSQRASV